MVVNMMIKNIMETSLGFRSEKVYVPSPFYADDDMRIATNVS